MERKDIRGEIPPDMKSRLIADEKVYYYASGGGCLGLTPKTYFLITDSRVLFSSRGKTGCLGIMQQTGSQTIPLEHISAIGTKASGCTVLPFLRQGVIAISSAGGHDDAALFSKPAEAEEAAHVLQEILREKKQ